MVLPLVAAAPIIGAGIGAVGNLLGGMLGNAGKKEEIKYQREFAQQGVRWRVDDARAAGIHPALAMGANIPSYSPVGLGSDLAEGFSNAGQDISRAINATQTLPEREASAVQTKLALENMGLQNDLLRAQIMGITRPRVPAFPTVTSASGDTTIPVPFGLGDLKVANPGLGQTAEDHFSDIGGFIFGGGNMLDSIGRNFIENSRPQDKARPGDRTPRWY